MTIKDKIYKIEYQIHSFAESEVRTIEEKAISVFIKEKQYIKRTFLQKLFFIKTKFQLVEHTIKGYEIGLKSEARKGFASAEEAEQYLKKLTEKPRLFIFDIENLVKKEIKKI